MFKTAAPSRQADTSTPPVTIIHRTPSLARLDSVDDTQALSNVLHAEQTLAEVAEAICTDLYQRFRSRLKPRHIAHLSDAEKAAYRVQHTTARHMTHFGARVIGTAAKVLKWGGRFVEFADEVSAHDEDPATQTCHIVLLAGQWGLEDLGDFIGTRALTLAIGASNPVVTVLAYGGMRVVTDYSLPAFYEFYQWCQTPAQRLEPYQVPLRDIKRYVASLPQFRAHNARANEAVRMAASEGFPANNVEIASASSCHPAIQSEFFNSLRRQDAETQLSAEKLFDHLRHSVQQLLDGAQTEGFNVVALDDNLADTAQPQQERSGLRFSHAREFRAVFNTDPRPNRSPTQTALPLIGARFTASYEGQWRFHLSAGFDTARPLANNLAIPVLLGLYTAGSVINYYFMSDQKRALADLKSKMQAFLDVDVETGFKGTLDWLLNIGVKKEELILEKSRRSSSLQEALLAVIAHHADNDGLVFDCNARLSALEMNDWDAISEWPHSAEKTYAHFNQRGTTLANDITSALARGDYRTAEGNAEKFIKKFPASPNGYYYLAQSKEHQGKNPSEVIKLNDLALSLTTKQLHQVQQAHYTHQGDMSDSAYPQLLSIQQFQAALTLHNQFLKQKQTAMNEILADPNNLDKRRNYRSLLEKNGDYSAAIEEQQKICKQDNHQPEDTLKLADLFQETHNASDFVEALKNHLTENPRDAKVALTLASYFSNQADKKKNAVDAIHWCEYYLNLHPDDVNAKLLCINACIDGENTEKAKEKLIALLKDHPNTQEDKKETSSLSPENAIIANELLMAIAHQAGDTERKLQHGMAILAINPKHAPTLKKLGEFFETQDSIKAESFYKQCFLADPKEVNCLLAFATRALLRGDTASAKRCLKIILDDNQDHPLANKLLEQIVEVEFKQQKALYLETGELVTYHLISTLSWKILKSPAASQALKNIASATLMSMHLMGDVAFNYAKTGSASAAWKKFKDPWALSRKLACAMLSLDQILVLQHQQPNAPLYFAIKNIAQCFSHGHRLAHILQSASDLYYMQKAGASYFSTTSTNPASQQTADTGYSQRGLLLSAGSILIHAINNYYISLEKNGELISDWTPSLVLADLAKVGAGLMDCVNFCRAYPQVSHFIYTHGSAMMGSLGTAAASLASSWAALGIAAQAATGVGAAVLLGYAGYKLYGYLSHHYHEKKLDTMVANAGLLLERGDYTQARKQYACALEQQIKDQEDPARTAKCHDRIELIDLITHQKQKDYAWIITRCTEMLKTNPNNLRALQFRSRAYTDNHQTYEAFYDLEKLLTIAPAASEAGVDHLAETYDQLAGVIYHRGNGSWAIHYAKQSVNKLAEEFAIQEKKSERAERNKTQHEFFAKPAEGLMRKFRRIANILGINNESIRDYKEDKANLAKKAQLAERLCAAKQHLASIEKDISDTWTTFHIEIITYAINGALQYLSAIASDKSADFSVGFRHASFADAQKLWHPLDASPKATKQVTMASPLHLKSYEF